MSLCKAHPSALLSLMLLAELVVPALHYFGHTITWDIPETQVSPILTGLVLGSAFASRTPSTLLECIETYSVAGKIWFG